MTKVERLNGEERLKRDALRMVADHLDELINDAEGDSPIERLFLAALKIRVRFDYCEPKFVLCRPDAVEKRENFQDGSHSWDRPLLVQPQAQMPWGRVDFLIAFRGSKTGYGEPEWHCLVVECDGHDWHDRTKEQASKDRERDREAQMAGYTVFRFTGRDLWRDALGCAGRVIDWAHQFA